MQHASEKKDQLYLVNSVLVGYFVEKSLFALHCYFLVSGCEGQWSHL
jgi:hypothetical protein